MTWLTDYQNRLNSISASSGPEHQTPLDIARKVLSAQVAGSGRNNTVNPSSGGGSFWDGFGNVGGRALDILSRPLYANANAYKHFVEYVQSKDDRPPDTPGGLSHAPNVLSAAFSPGAYQSVIQGAMKGWTGEEKTTSRDVISTAVPEYDTLPDIEPMGDGPLGGIGGVLFKRQSAAALGKFGLGLGLDIAIDPLTYIGGGAIKAGLKGTVGLGAKAIGKAPPTFKFGRAKNALSSAPKPEVLPPESLVKAEIETTGAATVKSFDASAFVKHLESAKPPVGKPLPFTIAEPKPNPGADWLVDSPVSNMRPKTAGHLADLAMVNRVGEHLASIGVRKHPKGVEIAPIYKEADAIAPVGKTVEAPVGKAPVATKIAPDEQGWVPVSNYAMELRSSAHAGSRDDFVHVPAAKQRTVSIPLNKVWGTQETVNVAKAKKLAALPAAKLPAVDGIAYSDGSFQAISTHRVAAAKLRGDTHIQMRLVGEATPPVGKVANAAKEAELIAEHVGTVELVQGKFHPLYDSSGKPALEQAAIISGSRSGKVIKDAKPKAISTQKLIERIKAGKLQEVSAYSIKVGGKLIPLEQFVKDAHANITFGTGVENAVTKVTPQVAKKAAPKILRLTAAEKAQWIASHQHLSEADRKYITSANNPKLAAKRIEEVKTRMGLYETLEGGPRTINELESMVKSGAIDSKSPEFVRALQGLLESTGAKGYKSGDAAVARALVRIAKAETAGIMHSGGPMKIKPQMKGETKEAYDKRVKLETKQFHAQALDPKLIAQRWMENARARTEPLMTNPVAASVGREVTPAGKLAEAVLKHGDTTVFDKNKIILDQAQADGAMRALQRTTGIEFRDPRNPALYPHVSKTGTKRTKQQMGEGQGRNVGGFNKWSQVTLTKAVLHEASKLIDPSLKGMGRSVAMYEKAMPMLHATEQMLRQSGIPITLGKGGTGLPLSMHDVLSALPREIVEPYFFNYHSALDPTQITNITESLVRLARNEITHEEFRATAWERLIEPRNSIGLAAKEAKGQPQQYSNYTKMFKSEESARKTADKITDAFEAAAPNIMQALERNTAEALVEIGEHTVKLTNDAIDQFAKTVLNPHVVPGDIIGVFKNPAKLIDEAAAGLQNVSKEAKDLAKIQLEIRMSKVIDGPAVHVAANAAKGYATAATSAERAAVATKVVKSADQTGAQIMAEGNIPLFDVGVRGEFTNTIAMIRAFHPHYGNNDLRPLLLARRSFSQSEALNYTSELGNVARKYTVEQTQEAFRHIQAGNDLATIVDPLMRETTGTMKAVWGRVFGDSDKEVGLIARNGVTKEELDRAFKHIGINPKYKLDPNDLANSWKTWDVADPLDLASKVHAAVQTIMAEKTLGATFTMHFASDTLKPGYVKIINTGGKSRIGNLIDTSKYYPEDIARQMHLVDKTLEEFSKAATNNKFLKLLDGTLHSLKAGLTIYRPGHHVRNQIGDMWLSFMDGVTNPKYYSRAFRVQATRNGTYEGIDAAIVARNSAKGGKLDSPVLELTHRGKTIKWSPEEFHKLSYESGTLAKYNIIEDLSFDPAAAGDLASRLRSRSPFKGKIHDKAAGVSEYRDHHVRISHMLYAMEKEGLDSSMSLEKAIKIAADRASARVRKWHPDGSDLSLVERTVARRSILFYSWIRKAIPLVVESAVLHPGRFMVYPKATYNMAEAMGIDLKSIGDQFPTDQLFPDWMQESTQGPLVGSSGNYWGAKPGIPGADVMDQYGSNPQKTLQTIASSVNPLVKIPMELAAGHSVGTGSAIKDKSEYIDAQVPFGGFIDKMTGKSMSSGFTQPVEVSPANVGYEADMPPWLVALLNMNTGLGVNNMSKPSYIKQGEFAARDRAKEEARTRVGQ